MQNPDIVSLIAASLDNRSLNRMSRTSKENAALLTPKVAARHRSLEHMAQQIIAERWRTPEVEYTVRTIENSHCIQYSTDNKFGPMALFQVAVDFAAYTITVFSRIGVAVQYHDTVFNHILILNSITIHPSHDRPLHQGTVFLRYALEREYTNFHPVCIVQWCPVV
jgi:hypothetical protein